MKHMIFSTTLILSLLVSFPTAADLPGGYGIVNLVANKQIYAPQIIDPHMVNGWGIAIRPAGAGGHFWISNTDTGTTSLYVGDVGGKKLYQDDVKLVTVAAPEGSKEPSTPTGQVFNGSDTEFIVTHEGLTGPSKFIFVTEDGTISGWTEKKKPDGTFERPQASVITIDNSKKGAIYKGAAITLRDKGNRLYTADFGRNLIEAFGPEWQPVKLGAKAFTVPDGKLPEGYAPFNIQNIKGTLYVAYAKLTKTAGEEEKGEGLGYIAAFDEDGKFKFIGPADKRFNAPWAFALAPANFGPASGKLLVGNFGDGRIVIVDPATLQAEDLLKRADGTPVEIDGLWGLTFGNGVHLGESHHLYFAAGPQDEKDGVFGKIVPQ